MVKLCTVISCLLLVVGPVATQKGQTQANERLLPQWLTGLIAVAGFLFLTFVGFLVKKAWCDESNRGKSSQELITENESVMTNENTYETVLDVTRRKEDENAYENLAMEATESKVTIM